MDTIQPVKVNQRVAVIDALRGFAIFGILLANLTMFGGYDYLPSYEYKNLNFSSFDSCLWNFRNIFIDTKFYSMFAMLFGAGFYFQFRNYTNNQEPFIRMYRRRLGFLVLFGIIHTIIWSGDFLLLYGLIGFVFILFRNLTSGKIIKYGLLFLMSSLVLDVIMLYTIPGYDTPAIHCAKRTYIDVDPEAVVSAFQSDSWTEVFKMNWHNTFWKWFYLIPTGRPTKILGLFLLGFYLAKQNFFSTSALKWSNFWKFFTSGLLLTLIGSYAIEGRMAEVPSHWSDIAYKALVTPGQVLLALSYFCLIATLFKTRSGDRVFQGFVYVGKMSFTNYLSQTLFGVVFFYGIGGEGFGTFSLAEIWAIAVLYYLFQIYFSRVWLKAYAFGPLEWCWRCLTYGKKLPLENSTVPSKI